MTLEEAITTAIDYETRATTAYLASAAEITDEAGRRVFRVLGEEEQEHVDYLRGRLKEWQETGSVSLPQLDSAVPARKVIEEGVGKLDDQVAQRVGDTEREMLQTALAMEREASAFYRRLVDELGEDGRMFERFLEIEEGHEALVQAELDYLNRSGTFFDFREFTLED